MKILFSVIIFVLVLALASCGGGGGAVEARGDAVGVAEKSLLTVEVVSDNTHQPLPDTIHLGRLKQGEVIKSAFTVDNNTTSPLVIVDVRVACGCAKASFSSKPVMSGESRVVEFTFNSKGMRGWQYKFFDVQMIVAGVEGEGDRKREQREVKVYFTAEVI